MNDVILISDLDVIEGKLFKHAADLDYVILDEVVHRQRRLPVARIRFAPLDLIAFMDDPDEDAPDEDEEDPDEGDDEDSADEPTEEGTEGYSTEVTVSSRRSPLASATVEGTEREEAGGDGGGPDDHLRRMCRAVIAWARGEVCRIMRNRPLCTFRLRFYKPKGGYVESKNFKAENPAYRPTVPEEPAAVASPPTPDAVPPTTPSPPASSAPPPPAAPPAAPAPPTPAPVQPAAPTPAPQLPAVVQPGPPVVFQPLPVQIVLPTPPPPEPPRSSPAVAIALNGTGQGQLIYLDPETIPEARVWRALGRATEEFLGTVGKTYTGIIDLQARTVHHQAEQLDKSQALVQNLAGQLLVARQVQDTDEAVQKVDEQQLRVREELGKTFLSELGSLGRVLASSKLGVAPELVELGDIIATSPELADAVRDPSVRAMLKDEETRKELARILLLAAKKGGGAPSSAA